MASVGLNFRVCLISIIRFILLAFSDATHGGGIQQHILESHTTHDAPDMNGGHFVRIQEVVHFQPVVYTEWNPFFKVWVRAYQN